MILEPSRPVTRRLAMKTLGAFLALLTVLTFTRLGAHAETHVLSTADSRLVLAFQVPASTAQAALPADWQPAPISAGPSTGANVLLIFVDGVTQLDADGKPAAGGMNRFVVAAIPATNPKTGAAGAMVVGGVAAHPEGAPGAYKNYGVAHVAQERTVRTDGNGPGTAEESWHVRDASGATLNVRLGYDRAMPVRAKTDSKVYSAVEPTFFRIYRVEQGADVVKSVVTGTDRVRRYEFRSTLGVFARLLDGNEKLVSITSIPWYVRQVFLP
jgi:hypothetical protein